MAYTVELAKAAAGQIRKLDRQIQVRIYNRLRKLEAEPRPPGAIQLQGTAETLHRIREGDYRIIYFIEDDKLVMLVVKIAHRGEAYR
jgi:mRNA interferase RelE/StbE